MKATLICYSLKKVTQSQRTALGRELNGYQDFSNMGKYSYTRKGILSKIPHIKPHHTVIIVKYKHKNLLIQLLQKYNTILKIFDIQINKSEFN